MNIFSINISFRKSHQTYDKLTKLFCLDPLPSFQKGRFSEKVPSTWIFQIEKDEYFDFINHFLNILEPKFQALESLGINRKNKDIVFWYIYEYEHQCNMEFHPEEMIRLGQAGIPLAISCFSKP
ncbi:hypothetical protein GCM10011514_41230 [Emticicia aquatilis]|uniref:DUF4279 domain-containing protein n=1 Tax=Emticicia aquatilis TaxID=1537369 RepID=A0A916Z2H8_9BACT|nr:hypothetical protein [Emticicia aquatilis]GGD72897.1 hypothetical protein GCM10011514_41230 [Emticicia aquatilis]